MVTDAELVIVWEVVSTVNAYEAVPKSDPVNEDVIEDAVTLNKRDSSPNHTIVPLLVLKCGRIFEVSDPVEAYN